MGKKQSYALIRFKMALMVSRYSFLCRHRHLIFGYIRSSCIGFPQLRLVGLLIVSHDDVSAILGEGGSLSQHREPLSRLMSHNQVQIRREEAGAIELQFAIWTLLHDALWL